MQEPTQTSNIPEPQQTGIIAWTGSTTLPFESPALSESNSARLPHPSSELSPATSPHHRHYHQRQQQQQQQQQQLELQQLDDQEPEQNLHHQQQFSPFQHSQISPSHHLHNQHPHPHQQQQQELQIQQEELQPQQQQHSQISPSHHLHTQHHPHHQQQQQQELQLQQEELQQQQQQHFLTLPETSHSYLQHSPQDHLQHQQYQEHNHHHRQQQQHHLKQETLLQHHHHHHHPHHQQQPQITHQITHHPLPTTNNEHDNIDSHTTTTTPTNNNTNIINNNTTLHVPEDTKDFTFVIQPPGTPTPYQVIQPERGGRHFEYANEDVRLDHHHHQPTSAVMTQNDIRVEIPEGKEGREAGGGGGGGGTVGGGGVDGGVAGMVVQVKEEQVKRERKRPREADDEDEEGFHHPGGKHLSVGTRCDVCGEQASGHYFGALVCLPCKSFFIRCTKDGPPNFSGQCGGKCDVLKGGRVRCQHCRFQKCISAGMYRKEKPEAVEPAEGQMLCKVCGDIANGVHFGVTTCEGCKKFFRRGLKENRTYSCKGDMRCSINPRMRNNCRYCRYQKCLYEGMSREAIKMGRPKKGDLIYRTTNVNNNNNNNNKTLVASRKNGFTTTTTAATTTHRQLMRAAGDPTNSRLPSYSAGHSPAYADEYGNSPSDDPPPDVYDPQSNQHIQHQQQQINVEHSQHTTQRIQQQQQHQQQHQHQQQVNPQHQQQQQQQQHDEMNLQHPRQQQQQQQQQGQAGFSLGALLHDSMTVEDWDVSGATLTSNPSDPQATHIVVTPSSDGSGGTIVVGHAQNAGGSVRVLEPADIRLSLSPRQQHQRQAASPAARLVVTDSNSNPVINLHQAHQNHLQPQHTHQQTQQSRHFYTNNNNDDDGNVHIHSTDTKHVSPAHHVDLSNVQQQQLQQRQPDGTLPVFDYLENDDPMTSQQPREVKFEKPLMVVDSNGQPFPNNVNMEEIQNFHTLTKVNFQQYDPQQPSPAYPESHHPPHHHHHHHHPHSPSEGEMVIPVSQLEPSVDSQIIVYSANNRHDQSSPHPHPQTHPNHNNNIILNHIKRSPPPGGYEPTTSAFDNPDHINLTTTPVQSEVVNLSQTHPSHASIVSLQHHVPATAATPLVSEELVASISRPVINGTNLVVLRNDEHGSPILSTYKTISSNRNSSNNTININNSVYASNINISSPHNSNIISQAMEIASQESSSNESNLEPYLTSDGRKAQSLSSFQQLVDNKSDNISQLRDFEELLLTKFGTKIITKQQQGQLHNSHSMGDLRIKKELNNSNNATVITIGNQDLNRGALNAQSMHNLPNIFQTQSANNLLINNAKITTADLNDFNGKIYTVNVNNNNSNAYNNININVNSNNNNNNSNTDFQDVKIRQFNPLPPLPPPPPALQSSDHIAISDNFNESDALDSAELHETNRVYMAIDNSCVTNGCYRRDPKCKSPLDDPAIMTQLSAVDFLPEVSHCYWHRFQPKSCHLTPDRQRTIDVICKAFRNLHTTYMSSETDCPKPHCSNSLDFWNYIQQTIARHVVAGQQFCKNIPDYLKLDIQDRISLGKHVGFGLMVLIACTEFYDPTSGDLKKIWTSKMPVHGALLRYREHLLSLGDKIHRMGVDRVETALLCAISMTSIDCPSLVKPDTVSEVQNVLIDSLEAYISAKGHSGGRLQILLGLMPQVRLMTVWYNNLMKKMSLPCDIINNKLCKKACLKTTGRIST